jgi:pimeloyl-ACP methyl ester carboxylesterase
MRTSNQVVTPSGVTVSYDRFGEGPPLILVHGGFSDHITNWQEAAPFLKNHFTVYSIARRGRGETSATQKHSVDDEVADIVAVLDSLDRPAFLLGHSYGAVCALGAAALRPAAVRKLILYEHPFPNLLSAEIARRLEDLGEREDWDGVVQTFMRDVLQVPADEVEEIRNSPFWDVWTADARATLNDLRALVNHKIEFERFRSLGIPVMLLIGSRSPRDLYITDALDAVLPEATIVSLEGQAHEGMTTAPAQFSEAVQQFLLAA